MMQISTYSEWVIILDRFGNGDDIVIDKLKMGAFKIDAGTAQRFYEKVEQAYKKRKQNWLDKFQRSLQTQNTRIEDLEITLRNGKQHLSPLVNFVNLNGLPEDLKKILQKDLYDFVAEIKKSMLDKISTTNIIKERMIVLLNSFSLPVILPEELPKTLSDRKNEIANIPSTGRKIIF
ncbi:hypothetical protein [Sphingobacterium sp. BIGb0165]|uniref:hypothetical protein n=1 Tax=Sphingobacterium sp. BIGb0165 TaxID=2940615 RepID=UPI00216A35D4|nr:hypothetical protein [Sphingobacterium sp. BIGb0165]MCS4228897.1 hypothetical protein [Sphingobacterium sp. BIGb0165]